MSSSKVEELKDHEVACRQWCWHYDIGSAETRPDQGFRPEILGDLGRVFSPHHSWSQYLMACWNIDTMETIRDTFAWRMVWLELCLTIK